MFHSKAISTGPPRCNHNQNLARLASLESPSIMSRFLSKMQNDPIARFEIIFQLCYIVIIIIGFYRYFNIIRNEKKSGQRRLPSILPYEAIILLIFIPVRAAIDFRGRLENTVISYGGWKNSLSLAWENASLSWHLVALVCFLIVLDRFESRSFRKQFLDRFDETRRQEGAPLPIKEKVEIDEVVHSPGQITKTVTFSVSSSSRIESQTPVTTSNAWWRRCIKSFVVNVKKLPPPPTAAGVVLQYHWVSFIKAFLAHTWASMLIFSLNDMLDDGRVIRDDPSLWLSKYSLMPLGLILTTLTSFKASAMVWNGWSFTKRFRDELEL